jgi:hypothetical protein
MLLDGKQPCSSGKHVTKRSLNGKVVKGRSKSGGWFRGKWDRRIKVNHWGGSIRLKKRGGEKEVRK